MSPLQTIQTNLLSPLVLAFVLGIVATRVRSDLKFPDALYSALSIYLLLAIGLKGGAELSHTSLADLWKPVLAALALGLSIPVWSYAVLRRLGRFSVVDAAAIAAHYGSVSAVTFVASLTFLDNVKVAYDGFMPALVALMEIPAIVVALLIAQTRRPDRRAGSLGEALHEILTGRSVLLLAGGVIIGALSGERGMESVAPFFVAPFRGALTLFLLEMGMVAAGRFRDLRKVGPFLFVFALVAPVLHGMLGVWLGTLAGLTLGGSMVLGALAASASYIAAPAAVRIALPEASPGYYLTAALAITFPFNLAAGLPLYYAFARLLHPAG